MRLFSAVGWLWIRTLHNVFARLSYDSCNISLFFVLAFSLSSFHQRLFFALSFVHYVERVAFFSVYVEDSLSPSVHFERVAFNAIFALYSMATLVGYRRIHRYLKENPPEMISLGLELHLLSFYLILLLPRLTMILQDDHSPWADEDLTMYIVSSGFLLLFSRVWVRHHLGSNADLNGSSLMMIMSKLTVFNIIDLVIMAAGYVAFGVTYVIRMSQGLLYPGAGRLADPLADSVWYLATILYFVSFTFRLTDVADMSAALRPWSRCCGATSQDYQDEHAHHHDTSGKAAYSNIIV